MAVTARQVWGRTLAALAVATAIVGTGPAGAQQEPTMTASPTTVRNGDSIQVTATGCLDEGSAEGLNTVAFAAHLSYPNSGNIDGLSAFRTEPAPDGSWGGTILVDTREEYFGPYEDYQTTLQGACMRGDTILFEYPGITITYDGTADDVPETTVPPTDPTTAPAPAPVPTPAPAPAAAPVSAAAAYTG